MTPPRFKDSSLGRSAPWPSAGRPFAWVAPDHPFHRSLAGLADAVEQDATAQAVLRAARQSGAAVQIEADMQAGRLASGLWMPARCHWSVQLPDAGAMLGMRARTMTWDGTGADRTPHWHDLPDDPRLHLARTWFDRHATLGRARVLHYEPLRRLTFAWQGQAGTALIGKFKRRSRHAQAYKLMTRVATLVDLGRPGFVVAQAGAAEPDMGLYFQTTLAGANLAHWLAPASSTASAPASTRDLAQCRSALAQVGRLHARLHALPTAGGGLASSTDLNAQLETARTQLAWIALMQPACQEALRAISARLHRLPAWHDTNARLCHGDPACSHVLVDGLQAGTTQALTLGPGGVAAQLPSDPARWALTGLDQCQVGDPCRDLGWLLASLAYDLPGLAEQDHGHPERVERWLTEMSQAYLHAYADEARQPLPGDRLIWQGLCAEVHYLALMLRKDRYHLQAFQRRLRHALALCNARQWL